MNLSNPSDRVSAVYGNAEDPMELDPSGVYNNVFNTSWNASGINPAFLGTVPELVDDTYATIGLEGPATPPLPWLARRTQFGGRQQQPP